MNTVRSGGVEKTLPMTVSNTGFMLDRLGQDCSDLQFLRELTQNAIEAILQTPEQTGDIVWDVDWIHHALSGGEYKLCITDTGIGMAGPEMVRYINQLSSSVHEQSHEGNFGVGAKIAAATRNHEGLVYLSWRDGAGAMIHLWRDPATGEYGLKQLPLPDGTYGHWGRVEDSVKPPQIAEHGTKVVLMGNAPGENTMRPPEGAQSPSRWISRYLNTRYFRFPDGIVVKAREGWENPRTDSDRNMLRTVTGQARYLEAHAEASGMVPLQNAVAHWWILRNEPALTQNSGSIASAGHAAALYNNELYEMVTSRSGVARLQLFGVIFGYNRVVLYVEPVSGPEARVTSNTARTHLLLNNEPLPWADWAAEFREKMPDEIKLLMEEVVAGSVSSDHQQAIRDRLRQIQDLFNFSRYRLTSLGTALADAGSLVGATRAEQSSDKPEPAGGGAKNGRNAGGSGNVYALFLAKDGVPAEPVQTNPVPKVRWITVQDGTRQPGFLEDRAAKYLSEQNILQINGDFRGFTDMVDRWMGFYAEAPGAKDVIQDVVREWFEQALIEAILGAQSLQGSPEWTTEEIDKALSEESLSLAVMPRYHIDVAVKRSLGAKLGTLKDKAS